MRNILIIIILLSLQGICISGEKLPIDFTYPTIPGDFYVNTKVSFQPGKVLSEDNITVNDAETGVEIPTKITVLEKWPDNSILEVEILFPANTNKKRKYVLNYGEDIKRRKKFTQTAILPIINSSIGKTPQSTEAINMDVGELLVKVDKSPDIRYYWYILPSVIFIFLTIYRTTKNSREYEE
ncbi:MAG: hypothetical protein N2589_01695 [bacterium]|nr:hypothetical protein [bacterium]